MTAPGRSHPMTHARRPRRPAECAGRRGQSPRLEAPTGPDPRGSPERRETDRLRSPGRRPERLPKHPPILTGSPTHRLTHQTARHLEDVTPNRRTGYPGRVVIAITGRKGGAGKSTVALHLAGALAETGRVALLDLDADNLTCWEYAEGGSLPYPVHTSDTWRAASGEPLAHLVIDAPARPTREQLAQLADRADLLVFPTTPDAVSLRVLARTLPDAPTGAYRVLLVRTPPRPSRDADRARRSLERGNVPTFAATIPEAAAFRHAARLRRLAWDVPGVRGSHIRLAFEELAEEVTT